MDYKIAKRIFGILAFILALTVYLLTLEPTTSFWDCSEFITCANNLEVGHAPGAPVFMLLGRLFALFANKPENIALMINSLSAVSSALTVMLLFFTGCWFAEQLVNKKGDEISLSDKIVVLVSAFIGALTFAFTDSFWFSAVEAEVYATSSLFTALVFWAILQYSSSTNRVTSYKWIILIFFILGLSVGIHLLNLLTLPAMALVVYFKHFKLSVKGVLFALVISGLMLVFFIYVMIPGIAQLAAFTDRIFVNTLNFPVYAGALFFLAIIAAFLYFSYQYFKKKENLLKQALVLCITFWIIGYSSFVILVIRSSQNPFVDINNVENLYGLVDYLNREQYPSRPLFYGNNYNSPIVEVEKRYTYKLYDGKYYKDELNPNYIFDKNTLTFFPRMASMDEDHIQAYKQWVNIKGRPVKIKKDGNYETIYVPTFWENFQFFMKYQLGYMYGRYFMWNFAGKQNDIQGRGDALHGNWLSGISILDNARLSNQNKLPDFYKNHKSRNTYYLIPFLLGIAGMVFQYKKDKNNFWVNATLFLFTGIAIVFYLNEIPLTPRERDYVHVGSFYVFAIWIGLGALGIFKTLMAWSRQKLTIKITTLLILLTVPILMLHENYNDHNRSKRYTAREYAKNILKSCEENAILFTTADNDTYPIWYLQEVEKYRTDVRNILLTFLPVDWYSNQLHEEFNERGSIPISFKGKELLMGENQYFPVISKIDSFMDVNQVIAFVKSKSEKTKVRSNDNNLLSYIPGKNMELNVDVENVRNSCSYLNNVDIEIPTSLKFTIRKTYLGRDDLLILDILAHNNWRRPIYFIYPNLIEELGLGEYLHREGMLYRFMPFKENSMAIINKARSLQEYNLVMNEFNWGNCDNPNVYLDHTNVQMVGSFRLRQMFIETATLLISVNEKEKAIEVLDKAQHLFGSERIPYSFFITDMVKAYKLAGNELKANELAQKIEVEMMQRYNYFNELGGNRNTNFVNQETLYILQQLADLKK